jgi:hypothetical protein
MTFPPATSLTSVAGRELGCNSRINTTDAGRNPVVSGEKWNLWTLRRPYYEVSDSLGPWLHRVALRAAIQAKREKRHRQQAEHRAAEFNAG